VVTVSWPNGPAGLADEIALIGIIFYDQNPHSALVIGSQVSLSEYARCQATLDCAAVDGNW